eukprot:scaffold107001_cov71-Phaeocystis_antarctica.AAC.1
MASSFSWRRSSQQRSSEVCSSSLSFSTSARPSSSSLCPRCSNAGSRRDCSSVGLRGAGRMLLLMRAAAPSSACCKCCAGTLPSCTRCTSASRLRAEAGIRPAAVDGAPRLSR